MPLLVQILIPFILVVALAGGALFAWRHWRDRPWLASFACALIVAAGTVILRNKWLVVVAALALFVALARGGRRRPGG